ncbi:MAG: hypothetical protein ACLTMP_12570 [Eggerthella lenta]
MSKKKMRAFAGAMAVVLLSYRLSGCAANDAEDNPQAQQELNADEQSRNEAEGSIGETVQYGQVMAMNGSTATVVVGTLANANDGSGSQAFNAGQDEITFDEGDVSIVDESGAELEGRTLSADDVIVMRGTGSGTDFKPTTIEILDVAGAERMPTMLAFPRASSSVDDAPQADIALWRTSARPCPRRVRAYNVQMPARGLRVAGVRIQGASKEHDMQLLKVSTDKLLLVAGIVWLIAGANIVNIGLSAFLDETGWLFWVLIGGTLLIFVLFHIFVFTKMVGKHASRIRGYEEDKTHLFKFFDKKGYIMMAIMMGGGIALRASGVVPEWFIAFFYTGWALRWRLRASASYCVTQKLEACVSGDARHVHQTS